MKKKSCCKQIMATAFKSRVYEAQRALRSWKCNYVDIAVAVVLVGAIVALYATNFAASTGATISEQITQLRPPLFYACAAGLTLLLVSTTAVRECLYSDVSWRGLASIVVALVMGLALVGLRVWPTFGIERIIEIQAKDEESRSPDEVRILQTSDKHNACALVVVVCVASMLALSADWTRFLWFSSLLVVVCMSVGNRKLLKGRFVRQPLNYIAACEFLMLLIFVLFLRDRAMELPRQLPEYPSLANPRSSSSPE